jgi:NTE family protein
VADTIGLVLAGGGARGAYEIGALSILLPWLEREHGQRPELVVGTSVGALNAAYIAANADRPVQELVDAGREIWGEIGWSDVLEALVSPGELSTVLRLGASLALRGVSPLSLLDPGPLGPTLSRLIEFERIHANVGMALKACAVVATEAYTNQSVVFHDGGDSPPDDDLRGIRYVATEIGKDHVRASAAIPVLFPGVQIERRDESANWYFDGGTRLNTPIKPALTLGAQRLIVIGLNSLARAPAAHRRPDLFDAAGEVIQAVLVDPLANDVATLSTINETLLSAGADSVADRRVIPYIFVTPQTPNAIGELAAETYRDCYSRLRGLRRSRDLALLGRMLDPQRSPARAELFSYLFFDGEFAKRLIALGRDDAARWTRGHHDDGPWELRRLPGARSRNRRGRGTR